MGSGGINDRDEWIKEQWVDEWITNDGWINGGWVGQWMDNT